MARARRDRQDPDRQARRRVNAAALAVGNSGVPATGVARRAGHGVVALLKIYAHRVDGQADAATQRITDALGTTEPQSGPGDEGDDDSEPTA